MKVRTYIREEVFRFPTFWEHVGNSHQILAQAAYGLRISTFDVDALVWTHLRKKIEWASSPCAGPAFCTLNE
jgi:hypothetical protein